MSRSQWETLFKKELLTYQQINEQLKIYSKNLNSQQATHILKTHKSLITLLKKQATLFQTLLKTNEFEKNHPAFFYFIQNTVQFKQLHQTDYLHFCMNTFKIMQRDKGKKLIALLNILHKIRDVTITLAYPPDRYKNKMFITSDDPTPPKPNAFWAFFEAIKHYLITLLEYCNLYHAKKPEKIPFKATQIDFHYPKNSHHVSPILFAGTEQALIMRIGFIRIAHELIHILHHALGTRINNQFPYPANNPMWGLYSYFRVKPKHEELATIEEAKQPGFNENAFRKAFCLPLRGSHISAPLKEQTITGCNTLLWLANKRLKKENLSHVEIFNLTHWQNPKGEPTGRIKTPAFKLMRTTAASHS